MCYELHLIIKSLIFLLSACQFKFSIVTEMKNNEIRCVADNATIDFGSLRVKINRAIFVRDVSRGAL